MVLLRIVREKKLKPEKLTLHVASQIRLSEPLGAAHAQLSDIGCGKGPVLPVSRPGLHGVVQSLRFPPKTDHTAV